MLDAPKLVQMEDPVHSMISLSLSLTFDIFSWTVKFYSNKWTQKILQNWFLGNFPSTLVPMKSLVWNRTKGDLLVESFWCIVGQLFSSALSPNLRFFLGVPSPLFTELHLNICQIFYSPAVFYSSLNHCWWLYPSVVWLIPWNRMSGLEIKNYSILTFRKILSQRIFDQWETMQCL